MYTCKKMADRTMLPASMDPGAPHFPPVTLSADAAPFVPQTADLHLSETGVHFSRCSSRLRSLRGGRAGLREELNLLFDQLISENYNKTYNPGVSVRPEEVCALLVHATSLVPLTQEHLVVKLCQLIHHLLNQLKVIVNEQTVDVLVSYIVKALTVCSSWTHIEILLALSTVVYGNGPQCHKYLRELLGDGGVLLAYSAPCQPNLELRRTSLGCMANICLGIPSQPSLEEEYRSVCFRVFLQTLQSPTPSHTDELLPCMVIQEAVKGLQRCISGGKWKYGGGEDLGSLLATLKRLMFQGTPGVCIDWPSVLYPTPLPQYEGLSVAKPPEPQKETVPQDKASGNKKKKSRGKGKRTDAEERKGGDRDEGEGEAEAVPQRRGGRLGGEGAEVQTKPSAPSLYPSWKRSSSDSEFSDPEGGAQSKLRVYHCRVRQGALHCLLAVVKGVDKRTLYGYWSSFIPDGPIGGPPSLTLLTIILKDPSPKVRASALQVLSALLDGSRQFLGVAEDTASPRTSFTPFSFTLATAIRELHRALSLALISEASAHTLTQVIKCLAHLVRNAPYQRLRPGLLSSLWKQIRPYVGHRDVNVRVSVLTLFGALVTTQAPLPEVQLLLRQPEGSGGNGSFTPQSSNLNWRQRDGASPTCRTPVAQPQRNAHTPHAHSPHVPGTPGEEASGVPWLLQLCVFLVTQPREDQSDNEGVGAGSLEPSPVRLEALQVLAHTVRGYFPLAQVNLCEMGQMSARCLQEKDPSIQLHGAKLLEEIGMGVIQQYRADSTVPDNARVPLSQVLLFWSEVLSGPLNGALQNEQHPMLQTSACDALASILPQAFSQLPDKTRIMCITVLLGMTYSEYSLVKAAAVRALGVYVLFPCLREDVMFVADTANTILVALDDRSPHVRAKAAWSLANLTDTLIVNMESVAVDFQEELSDMLLLKMLQSATKASADKDRVKSNAVRALGNLLNFLRYGQLTRSAFQLPLENAILALVQTVQSEATMKVRWNACYALGNAFRNPALPLDSAPWASDAFSSLCCVVTSCKNFKVRIKSATALSVPASRGCYGDAERFGRVWRSLSEALGNSEDTSDFSEYRYCASLRHALSLALLHLLSLSRAQDLPALGASLAGEEGRGIRKHLIRYLSGEEGAVGTEGEAEGEGECRDPQQRVVGLQETVNRLRREAPGGESGGDAVLDFLEDLLRSCEELKVAAPIGLPPTLP